MKCLLSMSPYMQPSCLSVIASVANTEVLGLYGLCHELQTAVLRLEVPMCRYLVLVFAATAVRMRCRTGIHRAQHTMLRCVAAVLCMLAGAYLAQQATDKGFKLKITSQFVVPTAGGEGALTIAIPEIDALHIQDVLFYPGTENDGDTFEAVSEIFVPKDQIQLWWPAGGNYGPHKLYNITFDFAPLGIKCSSNNATSDSTSTSKDGQVAAPNSNAASSPASTGSSGVDVDLDLSKGVNLGVNVGDLVDFSLNLPIFGSIFGDSNPLPAHPGDLRSDKPNNPARSSTSLCSFLQKRVGFRTVELVQEPLPQAIKNLFRENAGFNFSHTTAKIDGILAAEGWQWAIDGKGDWTSFPGNDPNVSTMLLAPSKLSVWFVLGSQAIRTARSSTLKSTRVAGLPAHSQVFQSSCPYAIFPCI